MSDKVKDKNNQSISVTVEGFDYTFDVTREAYNTFVNNVSGKTVQAMTNFLTMTVKEEQQTDFVNLLKQTPGAEAQIFGVVFDAYVPDLKVAVKKPKA